MLLLGYFDGNMKNWNTLKNQWWNVLRTCFLKYLSFKKMVLTSTSTYFVKPISSRHTFLFMYFLFHLDTKTSLSFFFLQLTYEIWNLFWHIHSHCIKVAWRKSYQLCIIPSSKVSQKGNNNKHPFTLTLFMNYIANVSCYSKTKFRTAELSCIIFVFLGIMLKLNNKNPIS